MSKWTNPDGSAKTIASFSAEQTATYFAGGDLGDPKIHDEAMRQGLERQRLKLRACVYHEVIPAILSALGADSQLTQARLQELAADAHSGDPRAAQLLLAMLTELLTQGLKP